MGYTIEYAEDVAGDLNEARAFDRARLLDGINEHLSNEPTRATRTKKVISGVDPSWEHKRPVWQLRIGEYRVFYDVDDIEMQVIVRAIRREPPHKTTEEIL
jgi:mRNA-degrading endonuclease RelE of RelBE toxin-antitoxin system